MGDLTVIILSILIIVLCWVIIKVNEKVDRHIKRFKKLEKALLKNATGKIPSQFVEDKTPPKGTPAKNDIPMAATSNDLRPQSHQYIAKK